MSYTSSFGFSNTTASTNTVAPIDLDPTTNYALKQDEPTKVTLDNKTCALDKAEILNYMCTDIKQVSTEVDIQHPTLVKTGVQYTVKLDAVLTTVSSTDANYRTDEPVVAYLTIRHQKSGNVNDAIIAQMVTRLIGACRRDDGTWRFDDLMRSALKPTVN